MIEIKNVSKIFDDIKALDSVTATINDGQVFGLIGTNGAGKSTLMRILCGVLKADEGTVTIDGKEVFDSEEVKSQMFYISDEQHFLLNSTPKDMCDYYSDYYKDFNKERFYELLEKFGLDKKRRVNTFSKGMKKQLSVLLGVCAGTKYLLCDETFDGLDPVMRQAIKSLFAAEISDRGLTPIVASHNLRELEDICDHVGLLHKGGILFSKDLLELKCNIHKMQCVFSDEAVAEAFINDIKPVSIDRRGSLYTITAKGDRDVIEAKLLGTNPIFSEILPLSLEEIFISETEVNGYDIKSLIM